MVNIKEEAISLGKDFAIALIILSIILGSLYVYSGRWPPMVVVESSSMSHSESSQLGIIDTGDIVVVKETPFDDIITYVEGKAVGHSTYGQYGDVIIFRPMGSTERTPVIHRPVVHIEYNSTSRSFDVPSLEPLEFGVDWWAPQGRWYDLNESLSIIGYGYRSVNVTIRLNDLLHYGHSGFITMGDNNIAPKDAPTEGRYDQLYSNICPAPVKDEWVEGKARGQLPWFGILKLSVMGRTDDVPANSVVYLVLSIAAIIAAPFVVDHVRRKLFDHDVIDDVDGEEDRMQEASYDDDDIGPPPIT